MLAFLDRTMPELPLGPRIGLAAMRLWAGEQRHNRCPIGVLRALFTRFGVPGALWPAHNFLYWVLAHETRPIELGCPDCGRVSEDEALLLAALFAPDLAAAEASLRALVVPVAVPGARRIAQSFGAELGLVSQR